MEPSMISVIYEDQDMIVCIKPPQVSSQPDKTGDLDLQTLLSEKIGCNIQVVHRLDRPVGGVMVYAKTQKSAAYLSKCIQNNQMKKWYFAGICGRLPGEKGVFQDYLWKDARKNISKVVPKETAKAQEAILTYEALEYIQDKNLSLVKIALITGRHHQIRVQFSHRGLPLWGDTKYNQTCRPKGKPVNIALWSAEISFPKLNGKEVKFTAYPKESPFDIFPASVFQKGCNGSLE